MPSRALLPTLFAVAACGSSPEAPPEAPAEPVVVRFATFNVSMHRSAAGALIADLSDPEHAQARHAAAILQEVRPDVVLLNEVDHDAAGEAARLLREHFLERGQDGREPLSYPYVYVPEVNTGAPSGVDLNQDGKIVTTVGQAGYGDDALGFGEFPGQYGMVVLSRHPIEVEEVRTFRTLLWKDVPDAWLPDGWYDDAALAVLPLSSKTHADVPIRIGEHTVHLLISHPTPPTFDGPEDRNGRRNHDEIRFWVDYLDAGADSWHVDDAGVRGGLNGGSFVIAGDLNADPNDGDSSGDPIGKLLAHPRVNTSITPSSAGAEAAAARQGGRNGSHTGDHAHDTADFNDNTVGNVRVDYVLPSVELELRAAGIFWPLPDDPRFALVGDFPFPVSDHRLVWVDVAVPQ